MAYVSCNGHNHPEFGLWPVELATDLRYALEEDGIRRIEKWCSLYNPSICSYLSEAVDYFSNSNLIDGIISIEKDSGLH
jgi:molybdopterin-guanine dinucleotide biosynthesis protein A